MEILAQHLSKIIIPSGQTPIYKDECVYTFDTPESPNGLYVSLISNLGFSEEYAKKYAQHTGNTVFLHIKREKFLKEDSKKDDKSDSGRDECGPERKITRLAIGVEGGYKDDAKNYEYKDHLSIVVMPNVDKMYPYPSDSLPLVISEAVRSILQQESATEKLEKEAIAGTWDGEVRQVSKFSDSLVQLENGKKIPPSGWKCDQCDLTNNLWLNLTDGSILCGRKFFDGSGGNDHAVEHYRSTGYPLAVKLGTITGDGKSDVFSYPEDDMVIDTKLEQHLAHFGINMAAMKKSEKSMVELELEINQRIGEWSLLTESDCELLPMSGPGYTGMRNLGNSCYINSVMQVIFTLPDFKQRFVGDGAEQYFSQFPYDPANDFNIQMAKLGNGLWSGKYSKIAENSLDSEATGIAPAMFKNVIGKNHPDFSTKQQQDAYLFYLHFINMLDCNSRHQFNPADALKFTLEERIECLASKKVKYTRRTETALPLQIPLEEATNLDEVKEYLEKKASGAIVNDKDVVRHKVPLQACMNKFFAAELIEQFYSPAIKSNTTAKKITRMASMPDYLMLHMKRFTLGDDWVPKKLDVSVEMPDEIDLSNWRGHGLQDGEEEWAEAGKEALQFVFDESVLSELMQMGFPIEACKRAIYHTSNSGLEAASNWIMEHIADADISDPFEVPTLAGSSTNKPFVPNAESMQTLMGMGFDERQVIKALKATDGNVERATDWIFSHADEMDISDETTLDDNAGNSKSTRDGVGKYKMLAFISHMGTSTKVGHYVCHIRKDDQWIIYNDSKVAKSQNPPKDLGYMYLYKREE